MTVTPERRLRQPLPQALPPLPAAATPPPPTKCCEASLSPPARCPLVAARLGWHHAARARPSAHAPLAARVGAAVPGRRPPHHRPQGKCVSRLRAPTCAWLLIYRRGKGGVRPCPRLYCLVPCRPLGEVAEIKFHCPPAPSSLFLVALTPTTCHR